MTNPPLVSVVVVCLNGMEISRRCLASIIRQEYANQEVIVVDNGSSEDIHGMVAREFPGVRLFRSEINRGFAGGHNLGIRQAHGKYVAIINNDAVAEPRWLAALAAAAEQDERIGAVASVILDAHQPGRLDSCGVGIALDGMSRQARRGRLPPVVQEPFDILMPSGCACLYRMSALEKLGLFDESFFAYCEDADLGLRLRGAGYTAVVAPAAEVHHYYSMTGGKFSLQKIYWVERNHFWLAVKNFPWPLLLLNPGITLWRYAVQLYVLLTGSGELGKFKDHYGIFPVIITVIKALGAALMGLPAMLGKRHALARHKKLNNQEMLKLLWRYRIPMVEIVAGVAGAGQRKKAD